MKRQQFWENPAITEGWGRRSDLHSAVKAIDKVIEGSSLTDLGLIAERLEDLQTFCQARLRLALPVEDLPLVDDLTVRESEGLPVGCSENAYEVARRLVSRVRRKLVNPNGVSVDFEGASLGCVRVVWEGSDMLWVVRPSELPWPGVSVRVYPPLDMDPRTLFTASEVVQVTLDVVERPSNSQV